VVLERLCELTSRRILPRIPEEGSVGASGDLTPLSYVAALLVGEREALVGGEVVEAAEALRDAGLEPLSLEPKESLALMNGTSVMTALACLAIERAERLARLSCALTAITSQAVAGNPRHFDAKIFALKPHPGTERAAAWIREDLGPESDTPPARLQDVYSLRCAPHVIGVLLDVLPSVIRMVEVELNGANDNPLIDPETGDLLHGGNFYGGHVCSAMDTLKTQVASIADLLDRQLALLCNSTTNHGLPINLVGAPEAIRSAHHGFKAMQITTSALAAEAAKLTMPASVFSRSTENHNQDKVSMGTIAARDCAKILDLAETVAAIATLACAQAVDLRERRGCHGRALDLHSAVRRHVPMVVEDREMRPDIDQILSEIRADQLPVGSYSLDTFRTLGT
jgi:histidine ammonia-lyase